MAQRAGQNHDRPDLALLANSLDLPIDPPQNGSIVLSVTIANLGETQSRPARLIMLDGARRLADATVPALKPSEQHMITMRLDGRLAQVSFQIEQEVPDFEPANDSLQLQPWDSQDPALTADARGTVVPFDAKGLEEPIASWGTFVNPARDCEVVVQDDQATITVPGGHHNRNPTSDYDNVLGPRLLQPVERDFTVEVKVTAFPRPQPNTSSTQPGRLLSN